MKKLLYSLLGTILLFSCTKNVGDQLPGQWEIQQSTTNQQMQTGKITFHENGMGSLDLDGEPSKSFTWTHTLDENVSITLVDGSTGHYEVKVNQPDNQEWTKQQGSHTHMTDLILLNR